MVSNRQVRCCKELDKLIREIRVDYILKGKRPPSAAKISAAIIKKYKVNKEALLYDKTIKL